MIRSTLAALVIAALSTGAFAKEPKELEAARKEYEQAKAKDPEAARVKLVTTLAKKMREYAMNFHDTGSRDHDEDFRAYSAEAVKHPAPKDLNGKALAPLLVGKWETTRHDFEYKKNGTYVMLPDEPEAARGKWRIEGNQFIQTEGDAEARYSLIFLDKETLLYSDKSIKDSAFILTRMKK
jgi:hypothetical protein